LGTMAFVTGVVVSVDRTNSFLIVLVGCHGLWLLYQ
jgi:hypothetical protein